MITSVGSQNVLKHVHVIKKNARISRLTMITFTDGNQILK